MTKAHEQEAAHLDIFPGVSSFLFFMIGGVERGKGAGTGADNRSI